MTKTSPIGIFTTDVHLNITSWNDWLEKVTGQSEKSVKEVPLIRVIADIEKRGFLDRFLRVLTEGNVEVLSSVFHHYLIRINLEPPVGQFTEMQQRVTIAPLMEDMTIHGTIVTIEDVTYTISLEKGKHTVSDGIDVLSSNDWRNRQEATRELKVAGKSVITEVLKKIRSEHRNLNVLNSAMRVLSLNETDVSDFLIEFLEDNDPELRTYAAQMLGEENTPAVIEALVKALEDEDLNVRFHAIEALGKLKAFQAVEGLVDIALSRDFFTAYPALDALRMIGDNRAARLLYPLVEDEMLGQPALEALAEFGEVEAVPEMARLINEKPIMIPPVVNALVTIANRYEEMLQDGAYVAETTSKHITEDGIWNLISAIDLVQEESLPQLVVVLGWFDHDETRLALTRFLGRPETRRQVIDALVNSGQKVVDLLIDQLSGEPEIQQAAVLALGRIGGKKTVSALIPMLQDDELAMICCGALAKIGDQAAFEPLLEMLGHPNASIRRAAIAALNSIGHPEMPARVHKLLLHKDPLLRESAARIAGYFGFPDCKVAIQKLCSDRETNVRIAAIESLPYYEDDRIFSAMKKLYKVDDPGVRAAVVKALGQMDNKHVYSLLVKSLDDSDGWVRYYAIKSIDMQGFTDAQPILKTKALQDPVPFVRMAAIEYLGHIGGGVAVSILSSITGDTDRDIASAAIIAIGNIHHPDSLNPLLALAKSSDQATRMCAIQAMGQRGGSGTAGALQWIALTEQEPIIKQAAIDGLRSITTRESVLALLNLTVEPAHREQAIAALASLPVEMLDVLSEGLDHRHPMVRTAVVEILVRIRSPLASTRLESSLHHTDAKVRLATIYALKRLGNRSCMKQLLEVKNSDPDPYVRKAAEEVLDNGILN